MGSIQTVKTRDFRKVLRHLGLDLVKTNGGSHEKWTKKGLSRPIIVQAHLKEIPEFILKNNCRTLGITIEEFFDLLGKA